MQRIINNPDFVVEDMLKGFLKCHQNLIVGTENDRVFKYKDTPIANKVGIVTGGGSGHKPAFIGYIGLNLLDSVAVGEVFSSPTAKAFSDAFKTADSGRGVACLYGNYAGDNMNVKMAVKMAAKEGIEVKTVVANDDVPSAPRSEIKKRRGVAGEILMWKIGGAKASQGGNLDEVITAAQKAIDNTRSIGIGLSPCTIPAVGEPNFEIATGTMEVGIGHHGEPGTAVENLGTAEEMAKIMTETLLPDLPYETGDKVIVLISGLGATPVMEQYILFHHIHELLEQHGISIHRSYVGNYFTSLEMTGVTLTLMKLDEELTKLMDIKVESMGLTQF